jgi:hypothetical protein
MKKRRLFSLLMSSFLTLASLNAQTARVQVIHNAADPAADSVDIYLNGTKLLDNFKFRAATPFIDAPAGIPITVGVAPWNSMSVADTLKSFTYTLAHDQKYLVVATGVLSPPDFASNPDGKPTAFTLLVKTPVIEQGPGASVSISVVHGAPDAPCVDVVARGVGTLVENAAYGDITGYLTVPPAEYTLEIKDSSGTITVASFQADVSGLAGGAAVVFASGFLDPIKNQSGKLFGLFAALPDGTVVELPATTARVQVIHNAADPAAATVDIYLNGQKLLENFSFRTATPFIDVPAGLTLNIGVAPGNSASFADTLTSFTFSLAEGEKYVAVANGVLNPAAFAPNPDSRNRSFTLLVKAGAREMSASVGNVQFFVLHGATDAPAVDVDARGVATLVDNASYRDITDYLTVPPANYTLDVKDSSGAVTVASFSANLSGLANGTAVVFASGFLTPASNQNASAFGLYAALPDGSVIPLSSLTSVYEVGSGVPGAYELSQNYPNPFNPSTQITFALPEAQTVRLSIFNSLGQQIATLADGSYQAGEYRVTFDATGLPSGMYFYRAEAGSFSSVRKMVLMK